jgi:hypothetical protein
MTRILLSAAAALTLVACGPSTDVATYQQSVSALTTAVDTHLAESASTTTANCVAEHQRYDDLARPELGRMTGMSGGMDGCASMMGRGVAPFGMREMCGSMQSELDRHAAAACAGDVTANHAEAAHHCQMMRDWLTKQSTDTRSMMGGRCN